MQNRCRANCAAPACGSAAQRKRRPARFPRRLRSAQERGSGACAFRSCRFLPPAVFVQLRTAPAHEVPRRALPQVGLYHRAVVRLLRHCDHAPALLFAVRVGRRNGGEQRAGAGMQRMREQFAGRAPPLMNGIVSPISPRSVLSGWIICARRAEEASGRCAVPVCSEQQAWRRGVPGFSPTEPSGSRHRWVLSRFMRKKVCRLRLNEVNQQ